MNRTHNNGELRISDVNKIVELKGWVAKKRNLGSLVFIDLRDRYGITQIVLNEEMEALGKDIKNEYVLHVVGKVIERSSKNPNMPTGDIEIEAAQIDIINTAKVTPIYTTDDTDASEDARMQYRYLDLRRPVMQNKIIMRHKITSSIRNFLDNHEFIDIETPYLNRSTPEGARDFLVPSRVHNGSFYALPQSPQLFKQLLMVSGFERYYQIARCFRDEDLRLDRQLEFTQVDVEMSFMTTDEIISIGEQLLAQVMKDVKGIELQLPLPRMTWHEAMEKYGIDKPDIRFGLELVNLNEIVKMASCVLMAYLVLTLIVSLIICQLENISYITVLFECVSAIATVGLTIGITSQLGVISQCLLALLMLFGRVGSITFLLAFASNRVTPLAKAPAEKIQIG